MENKNKLRLLFLGTPEFAAFSLRMLLDKGYNIVGVVTAEDKPAGRGLSLSASAVKQVALEFNVKVLQPKFLKDESFLAEIEALNVDLAVVVAFRMMPKVLWAMPRLGTFNLHSSLLPNLRGAAPINWALIHGLKKTGVTSFFINEDIDTGDILLQKEEEINDDTTLENLYKSLMTRGAETILETVELIELSDKTENKEVIKGKTQDSLECSEYLMLPAPKLTKENTKIHFRTQSALTVVNLVRGLSPYPTAWAEVLFSKKDDKTVIEQTTAKIFKSIVFKGGDNRAKKLIIECKDGLVEVLELQLANKKRITGADFINSLGGKEFSFL